MKKGTKIFLAFVIFSVILLNLSSATTVIMGRIFNADFTETIPGAQVRVTCSNSVKETISGEDGYYQVIYSQTNVDECARGDTVIVEATKGNLYGSASGFVDVDLVPDVDIALVNVPLVPEFGIIAGITAVLGAIALFFIIRK